MLSDTTLRNLSRPLSQACSSGSVASLSKSFASAPKSFDEAYRAKPAYFGAQDALRGR